MAAAPPLALVRERQSARPQDVADAPPRICPGKESARTHDVSAAPPRIITFNDTIEWLGVFMDNGFACTEKNATESATATKENSFGKGRVRGHIMWLTHHPRICPGKESARTHDVSAAPFPDLHLLFNEVCLGPGIVGLDAKAIGPRLALASLESLWCSA